jgi:transposase-like protein
MLVTIRYLGRCCLLIEISAVVQIARGKAVVRDLQRIYQAATLLEAEQALEDFAQAWQASYPTIIKMLRAAGRAQSTRLALGC